MIDLTLKQKLYHRLIPSLFLAVACVGQIAPAEAANGCLDIALKKLVTSPKSAAFASDQLIQEVLGEIPFSYQYTGQPPLAIERVEEVVNYLTNKGLDPKSIQRAHQLLTEKRAALQFRGDSGAKILGQTSVRAFHDLAPQELKAIEANPFLTFVNREGNEIKLGHLQTVFELGDIEFPSVEHVAKFKPSLSQETLDLVASLTKNSSRSKIENANRAIVQDLLEFSLKEAEQKLASKANSPAKILAELEWRLKSLGLYYEAGYASKGKYLEPNRSQSLLNRSSELAESIVDAFARRNGLGPKNKRQRLDRTFRPSLTEPLEIWESYMNDALTGEAPQKLEKLNRELGSLGRKFSEKDREAFKTYAQTRLLTGYDMASASKESFEEGFIEYQRKYLKKSVPETQRATLIPMDYIENFGTLAKDYPGYLEHYYDTQNRLYRGVSYPDQLSEESLLEHFVQYKSRYAPEYAQAGWEERTPLAKLAMLRYNAELIEGKLTSEATQHANKHLGFTNGNSANSYLASMTKLNTVAFRFAMDQGYVSRSSSAVKGNTSVVIETYRPKNGLVDFATFKKTDPNWRNRYPRQFEAAVAGGIDPNSVARIYVLEPYPSGAKRPSSGPEKHGRIAQIFERDLENPRKIWLLKKDEKGNWVRGEEFRTTPSE